MTDTLVVYGVGQLGRFLGGGALRCGLEVVPVLRSTPREQLWARVPDDAAVLIAVGEADLDAAIADIPDRLWSRTVLVQNELFPSRWADRHGDPTVAVMWTNVKPGQPILVGRSTGVSGAAAHVVADMHEALGVACRVLSPEDLRAELAAKYAFIVVINALGCRQPPGLTARRTVGAWCDAEPAIVEALSAEATELALSLADTTAVAPVRAALSEALQGFEEMPAGGRSAAARVRRALTRAEAAGLAVPTLTESLPS